jgi:hypothetical protein
VADARAAAELFAQFTWFKRDDNKGVIASILIAAAAAAPQDRLPEPPVMMPREISPRAEWPGVSLPLEPEGKAVLFIPSSAKPGKDVALTLHFHSATWHAIQEHLDRGLNGPLIAFYPGEGSSTYANAFSSPDRLRGWMERTLDELRSRGWDKDSKISALEVSSFSAGYGAVREMVKWPWAFALIRRVVLADSLYGSLRNTEIRAPVREHVEVWKPLAVAAVEGKKTLAITTSSVPTPQYASSKEVALALMAEVGGVYSSVDKTVPGSPFPLLGRCDKGRFHFWHYGGSDGQAHMAHARHLAAIWRALDGSGAP